MDRRHEALSDIVAQYQSGRIDRRSALKLIAGLGIAAVAAPALGGSATAQDAASPEAMATPVVGPQADGTNLWKVQVGGMDMANGIDVHGYFPSALTIDAGDSVYFQFAPMGMPGFHTVTFASGGELPPLFAPDIVDGTPVASPEGPPRLVVNPAVAFPDGRTSYDGTGLLNSGLDVFRMEEGPYVVAFDTPGTYEYVCVVHAIVMKGTIIVHEAGAELPADAAASEAAAQEEFAAQVEIGVAALAEAEAAVAAATPAAGAAATVDVYAGAGGLNQARIMRFIPRDVTVKVGDTVRWTNASTGEPHTVTFLGGTEPPEDVLVEPGADGAPKFIQNYQTLMPAGEATFDGTGYHNSGFLGMPPEIQAQLGLNGDTYELTFTEPGEYPYYCILHASGPDDEQGMAGTVTVTA